MKSERVGRLCKLAGNEFQTVGAMKLKERSSTDLRLRLGIFKRFSKVSHSVIEGCMKSDMCRKKLKGKREVYR